LESSGRERYH